MKSFRRLLKGFWSSQIGLFCTGLFVLVLVIVAATTKRTVDDLIYLLFCYIVFSGLCLLAVLIYDIIVVTRYINARNQLKGILGFSAERFDREAVRMPRINGVVLCSDAICYTGSHELVKVIPIQDIVWVYQEQVQNALFMHIHTKDRDKHSLSITMKKKYGNRDCAARFMLRLIARKNKGAIIGYREEYDKMFEHNFGQLLEMTYGKEIVDSNLLEQEYIQNDYYTKDLQ